MDWIITKDRTAEPDEASFAGRGMRDGVFHIGLQLRQDADEWRKQELIFQFQLLNDDGEIDLDGECGDIQNAYELDAFAPLDWASDLIGCTELRFRLKGSKQWQTL